MRPSTATFPIFCVCAGISLLGPIAWASGADAIVPDVRSSAAVLLSDAEKPGATPSVALATLLRAVAQIAREAKLPEGFRSKLDPAVARVRDDALPDERTLEELRSAYAVLNGGRSYEFPPAVHSLDAARDYGRRQTDRGVAALEAGRHEEAVREILGVVLLIATPMEAPL